ncbi:MAG: hypothetical protein K8F91_03170 [Candidatus Obscuribacterales bacterium]|nr:hypothetical protein [Candidatus Obscuribacterales bacterium]
MKRDTYTLMHKMFCVASSKKELEIVLRRFQEVADCTANSARQEDQFDEAWATSCIADIYARLHEPALAEHAYREAIRLFEDYGMFLNAAVVSFAFAAFFKEPGRLDETETMLKQNIHYLLKYWGAGNHHVLAAEEELKHFQLTGEIIEAYQHSWCKACQVDKYGVGFDFEDSDKAEK